MADCPDYFAPLEAWRKFNVRNHGRLLVSVNHPIPLLDAEPPPAECLAEYSHPIDEPCPALDCTCGYYAYKTRGDAIQHGQGHILAKVALWGRIAQHTRGYRAERLRVVELIVPPSIYNWAMFKPAVEALSARYRVPVIEGDKELWTSENANASSLSNQSLSLSVSQQNSLIQHQQAILAAQLQAQYAAKLQQQQAFDALMQQKLDEMSQRVYGRLQGTAAVAAIATSKAAQGVLQSKTDPAKRLELTPTALAKWILERLP